MKKTNLLMILAICCITLSACGQSTPVVIQPPATQQPAPETTLPDLTGREVTIAVENAYKPFNWIDTATGEPAGWDYEVWGEICSLLNCKPVFKEVAWEAMIQGVSNNLYDTAGDGITITEARKEIVDFSDGYMSIELRLLVRKENTSINSIDDMAKNPKLKLATQTGTSGAETAAKYLPASQIMAFEQVPFALQAVISGDVDAMIVDAIVGLGYIGENADSVKLVGPAISSDQLGFPFPTGSDLVAPVNAALSQLKSNGFLDEMLQKYFSKTE